MKRLILILVLAVQVSVFGAPFGLKMGMTLKQIARACGGIEPKYFGRDFYRVVPARAHPLFTEYAVYVDKKYGLYHINASTNVISFDEFGTELKAAFKDIVDRVAKTYGDPLITEEIRDGSIWQEEKDWAVAFREGTISLEARWGLGSPVDKDDIDFVVVSANAVSFKRATISIDYRFKNYYSIEDAKDFVF